MKKIANTSWGCNIQTMIMTYKGLIQNSISFGIAAWGGNVPEEVLQRINIDLIHPALRIIGGNKRWCRIENLYLSMDAYSVQNLSTTRCAQLLDRKRRIASLSGQKHRKNDTE